MTFSPHRKMHVVSQTLGSSRAPAIVAWTICSTRSQMGALERELGLNFSPAPNCNASESKKRRVADLEVVMEKELPPVFTGPASVTQTHHVNTWFVSHMRNLFRGSTQTTRPRERRCWWGSHAEMLKMSTRVPNSVLEPRPTLNTVTQEQNAKSLTH
eukprot:m.335970 g.335970  ORF g.335970 m.335970 type:complete len:157 (-) comp27777_c0_seq12:360-830(-)